MKGGGEKSLWHQFSLCGSGEILFPPQATSFSRCKSLVHPLASPFVGHGPQGCADALEVSEDDAIMQTVGLTLPELYDFWLQDVASPGRERNTVRERRKLFLEDTLSIPSPCNPHAASNIRGVRKEVNSIDT